MAAKSKKRRPKGSLETVLRGLYAMFQRHTEFCDDAASDHATIVKSSNVSVQLALSIVRVVEAHRDEKRQDFLATLSGLQMRDVQERAALPEPERPDAVEDAEVDEAVDIPCTCDDDYPVPAGWEILCEQSWRRMGNIDSLEQSLVLYGRPRPNKELVQAAALAEIGQVRPVVLQEPPPVPPPAVRRPAPRLAPDPEETRLAQMEEEVRSLIRGVHEKIR